MEEFIANIAKELPSTGVLLLFIFMVDRQFNQIGVLIAKHMEQTNSLLEMCLKSVSGSKLEHHSSDH